MKKNFLALGLASVLTLSLMTGCSGSQQNDDSGSESNSSGMTITAPAGDYTGGPTWGKPVSKMVINFEGRVAFVEDDRVTLEDGTVVLTDGAEISAPDGSVAEIAAGDYIQGYAEDPDAAELNASSILITIL